MLKRILKSKRGFTLAELLIVATLLGGVPTASYIGIKNKAYEIQCANNLRQIGLTLQMFEIDRGGLPNAKFFPGDPNKDPQSIKVILKSYGLPDAIFICPTSPEKLKKLGLTYLWNDEVSGRSLYSIKNPSQTWLMTDITAAYEEVSSHRGGYNVLYADFHVAWSPKPPFELEYLEGPTQPEEK